MNTHDDQLERLLSDELHGRADGLGGLPFGIDEVKGRAGRIRRNRRIAASAVVAAAVGVIVPTVLAVTSGIRAEGEIMPAPQPDVPTVARTTLTLDGLERGPDPRVEYFTADGVVLSGEGLQPLDRRYQALVPSAADGGWVAVEPDGYEVRSLTEDFDRQSGTAKNLSFVTTPDRGFYAFVAVETGAQTLVLRSTTDPEDGMVWDLPAEGVSEVVGFLGEGRLVVETTDQTTGRTDLAMAESDGSVTDLPDYGGAISTSPVSGLIAVQTKSRDDGSGCFGVVDPDQSDRPLWETCANSLGAFSPDGELVMGSGSYQSGEGPVELQVLDAATGDVVTSFTPDSATMITLLHPTWESNDAIIAPAYEGEVSTILRFGVDGTLEETVDRLTEYREDRAFYLGQDRRGM